jgi:hypothetical protein
MAGYVVEVYVSRLHASVLDDMSARARRAAEELTRTGTPVVYMRSVFLPEDETCFHFFEAPSREAIRETCSHLGLTFERIAEATSVGHPTTINPDTSS